MADKQTGILIGTLFLARDLAHREHLKTRSYARHKALDAFYSEIVGLADSVAEGYQGLYANRLNIPLIAHESDTDIAEVLRGQLEWIHKNRYDAIPKEQTALHNAVDDIEKLYMDTLYQLSLS